MKVSPRWHAARRPSPSTAERRPILGRAPWGLNTFWVQATDNAQFTAVPSNAAYANYPTLVTCTGVDDTQQSVHRVQRVAKRQLAAEDGQQLANLHLRDVRAEHRSRWRLSSRSRFRRPTSAGWTSPPEILNYGIAGPSQLPGTDCYATANPSTKAILRVQRLRDTPRACKTPGSLDSYDYWPNVLFDTREGLLRDVDPNDGRPTLGGLMNYIELDVKNLSLWFKCAAPYNAGACSGNQVITNNGYSVYFSDRRGNVNPGPFSTPANPANVDGANLESGEYGFEDFVNPTTATGTPSSTLDGGEDINANGQLGHLRGVPELGQCPQRRDREFTPRRRNRPLRSCEHQRGGHQCQHRPPLELRQLRAGHGQSNLPVQARPETHPREPRQHRHARTDGRHGKPRLHSRRLERESAFHSGQLRGSTCRDVGDRRRRDAALERMERRRVVLEPVQPG